MKTTRLDRERLRELAELAHQSPATANYREPLSRALADLSELAKIEREGPQLAAMRLILSEIATLARQLKDRAVLPHSDDSRRLQEIIELSGSANP